VLVCDHLRKAVHLNCRAIEHSALPLEYVQVRPVTIPDLYPYFRLDTRGRSQNRSPLPWGEGGPSADG